VFEIPGCYARATSRDEAVRLVPEAIKELNYRVKQAHKRLSQIVPPFTQMVAEEYRFHESEPGYLVNAFFENDKIRLTRQEITDAEILLDLNHRDLMSTVNHLPERTLSRSISGEVQGNISGILKHIGGAEWWYWDRLGLITSRDKFPKESIELLESIRDFSNRNLTKLVGLDVVTKKQGETWSARKLLRRMIWHIRVHTVQIQRYLKDL
jgi:hypothetical protein